MTSASTPILLVTGATGQVGHSLARALAPLGRVVVADVVPVPGANDARVVDFTDEARLVDLVRTVRPTVIVNPAAYTNVDKAETDEPLARQINVRAPARLAEEAARLGAGFVHYSTDYVFDGSGFAPRDEQAPTGPLNAYGRTKLDGETAVLAAHPGAVVLRTSWVFSAVGHNFVKTMLRFGAEREELKVVADQVGAPTSADFLATMTTRVVQTAQERGWKDLGGVYHLTCTGETSWHGFALEIFRQARAAGKTLKVRSVVPLATEEWPTPAQRPRNSRLDCGKFRRTFGVELESWEQALARVMRELAGS